MAKLTRDEFLAKLKTYTGDRSDDETLSLIEDATDSYTDDGAEWENKYNELDKSWREKYKARFYDGDDKQTVTETEEKDTDGDAPEKSEIKIEDLFTE